MKVTSIKKFSFDNYENKHIEGVHLLLTEPSTVDGIEGHAWEIVKFSSIEKYDNILKSLGTASLLHKEVQPIYNRYGKVENFIINK